MGKKHKKAHYNALKIITITIFSLFILTSVAIIGAVLAIIKGAPALDVNQILTLNEASVLYNDKNEFMDKVVITEQRNVISFNNMPDNLKNAFVSIEDERFYKHGGIDVKRIIGSMYIIIKNRLKGSSTLQGGSTITQQLLKNTILSSEVSWKRKIQEAYLAIELEKQLSKDQILEAYMNTILLGGNAYGVEAASQQYFSKPAKDLNLIECAFIAGIPQSPSVTFSSVKSVVTKNDESKQSIYINRTETVLMKMYENGYISQEQYNTALNDLTNNKLAFHLQLNTNNRLNYEAFSLPAIDQVKKDLEQTYHYSDTEAQHLLMYGGLKIYTTMDKTAQDNTQKLLNDDSTLNSQYRNDKSGKKIPIQASAVVMDYHTGEVKVIIGGRGNQPAMSLNRADEVSSLKSVPRRPGSSIKPLTVYAPAIDSKNLTAATEVEDAPLPDNIAKLYGQGGNQYPKNDDNLYGNYGESVTLRNGLMHSLNTVAARVENQIGLQTGVDYAQKFGLKLDPSDKTSIAALSLGQLTNGTYPLNMAAAYGVFGNNGLYTSPKLYRKIVDRTGKVLLENKTETKQIISPESAYIMYDLLKGPVSAEGTGPRANFSDMPVRGKTGTSGDEKDLWFSGLTPYYSAAVWVGYDDHTTISGINSNNVAGIWSSIMQPIHNTLQPKNIDMPKGVVSSVVCEESGNLPTSLCYSDPTGNKTYSELFIDGTVPTDYCNLSHSNGKSNSIFDKLLKPFKNNNDKTNVNNDSNTNVNNDSNTNINNNNSNTDTNNNSQPNNYNTDVPNNNGNGNVNPNNINPKKTNVSN